MHFLVPVQTIENIKTTLVAEIIGSIEEEDTTVFNELKKYLQTPIVIPKIKQIFAIRSRPSSEK